MGPCDVVIVWHLPSTANISNPIPLASFTPAEFNTQSVCKGQNIDRRCPEAETCGFSCETLWERHLSKAEPLNPKVLLLESPFGGEAEVQLEVQTSSEKA